MKQQIVQKIKKERTEMIRFDRIRSRCIITLEKVRILLIFLCLIFSLLILWFSFIL